MLLNGLVIPRVACRVFEDTDSLDDVVASYLQGGALAPAEIARYFELMAALWRAAPWRFFGDRQVLELDVPTLDVWGACVAVLGALGQMFGVVVFESFEEFEQFYAKSDPQACPADDDSRQPGVASLALTFNRGADLPAEMRFEVARQGWVVANADAYPLILPVEPDAHVRTATERDLRLACAAVAALAALIREHAQRLRARSGDELVTCISLDFPEPLEVTLGFPHSRRRKAIPGPRRPFALGSEHEHRLADRRLDEFHASELASRHLEGWLRSAVYMIDMFHGFKLDFQDGRLEGLRASHIAEFLLDYVPREVLADEEMVWHTPEVFDTYLEWLGESGREPRPTMTRIRGLVRYLRKRFIRRALDPLAFSPGKTFFVAALRAGVDLEDFAAVAAYHEDYARRCDMALEFMAEANSRSPRTVQIVRTTG